jgi:hypothetical protein
MWEKMDDFAFLIVGVLLVLFRKECAKFVIWYHRRRWYRRTNTKSKHKEYPQEAWSAGNYFVQIFAVIMGLIVATLSLLSLLGILKVKP